MKSAVRCCLCDVARLSRFEYPDGRPAPQTWLKPCRVTRIALCLSTPTPTSSSACLISTYNLPSLLHWRSTSTPAALVHQATLPRSVSWSHCPGLDHSNPATPPQPSALSSLAKAQSRKVQERVKKLARHLRIACAPFAKHIRQDECQRICADIWSAE